MKDTVQDQFVKFPTSEYKMESVFLVDIGNLYHCIAKRFEGKHLDYNKLLNKAKEYGNIQRCVAYGAQNNDEANNFITCIRSFGYEVKYKKHETDQTNRIVRKAVWDVGLTVDMIRFSSRFHNIILGSADTDLLPGVQFVRESGAKITCLSCGIPREMRDNVDFFHEITEELLQDGEHK